MTSAAGKLPTKRWQMQNNRVCRVGIVTVSMLALIAGCQKKSADQPKSLVRPAFSFNYPSSWTVDEKKDSYDPDRNFFIDASEGAFFHVLVFEGLIEPTKTVGAMANEQEKNMSGISKSSFPRWGSFEGSGTELRGKMRSFVPTTIRIFAFNTAGKTFVITEFVPDNEKEQLSAGYQMIQDSFKLNH